jgi:hypothetical protein
MIAAIKDHFPLPPPPPELLAVHETPPVAI